MHCQKLVHFMIMIRAPIDYERDTDLMDQVGLFECNALCSDECHGRR